MDRTINAVAEPMLHHVALLVGDLDAALARYSSLLGGSLERFDDDEPLDCRWAHLVLPGSPPLEFVSPRSSRSPYARDLERRGEGLHHISFQVADVGLARRHVEGLGLTVLGFTADHSGWEEFFVHPGESNGALLHFCVPPR